MATDDYQFAEERSPIPFCQSMVAKEEQLESANDKGILEIFDTLDIDDFDTSGYDDDLVLNHEEEGASIVSDADFSVVEPSPEPLPRETSSFMDDDKDVRMLLATFLPEEKPQCFPDNRSVSVIPPSPIPSKEMGMFLSSNGYLENTAACLPPPPPPLPRRVVTPTLTTKKKKKAKMHTKATKKPTKKRAPRKKAPKVKQYVSKTELDVLLGRGGCSNHHVGNATYRKRILELQPKYKLLSRQEKTKFSHGVVEWVQNRGGRFLKRDKRGSPWYITTDHEARAKISQALREDHSPQGRAAKKARLEAGSKAKVTLG